MQKRRRLRRFDEQNGLTPRVHSLQEYNRIKTMIPFDGMYDRMAERIVKEIKEEIVR